MSERLHQFRWKTSWLNQWPIKFTYLGSDVSGSSSTPDVHRRIGRANSILGELDRVWRNRRLTLNTKLRLYTSLVQSVFLHGSETWTLTKARLQAFHVKAQRCILNIKWHDFVTSDSVRSQTKLTDLPLIIDDRRHSLLGHVCRLPPDVPAHNILQHCLNLSQGRCPAPTGSVHLAGQGRPGYNRWKRITDAQSTRCGHRRRIARCGGRYGPRWSGAAVSEWLSIRSYNGALCRETRQLAKTIERWYQLMFAEYRRMVAALSKCH